MYKPVDVLPAESLEQLTVIDFGTNWCGYCQAAKPLVASIAANYLQIHHIQVEDGKGKRLGRLYRVKLWPTLIFLKNGQEIKRLVRPNNVDEIQEAFDLLQQ